MANALHIYTKIHTSKSSFRGAHEPPPLLHTKKERIFTEHKTAMTELEEHSFTSSNNSYSDAEIEDDNEDAPILPLK
jgi:hypothetical protein